MSNSQCPSQIPSTNADHASQCFMPCSLAVHGLWACIALRKPQRCKPVRNERAAVAGGTTHLQFTAWKLAVGGELNIEKIRDN